MTPIATCVLSNVAAIAIYSIEYGIEDYVSAGLIVGDNAHRPRRHKIYTAKNDRPFFRMGNMRIYLDECMRITH